MELAKLNNKPTADAPLSTPPSPKPAEVDTIWTFTRFNWALEGHVANVLKGGDYVTEMWSTDYFAATKEAVAFAKESLMNVGRCLYNCDFADAGAHFVNLLCLLVLLAVNIQLGNFIKGIIGTVIAAGKSVYHAIAFAGCLVGMILFCWNHDIASKCYEYMTNYLGDLVKDIAVILSCVGHSIPSWLPLFVFVVCPPAGAALAVVKVLARFTGIFEVVGYTSTALQLYAKYQIAKVKHRLNPDSEEDRKAVYAWRALRQELYPGRSFEGTLLAGFAMHVIVEGLATLADFFLPAAGTIITYTSYGVQAVASSLLLGTFVYNKCSTKAEPSEASAEQRSLEL